jgi:ribosome biogenesis ATPase
MSPSSPPKSTAGGTLGKKRRTRKTPSRSSSTTAAAASSSRVHHKTRDNDENPYRPLSHSGTFLQPSPRPTERYSDLGGISPLLRQLRELIEYPLSRPELFLHLGVEPPRGVLLRGPPGCGKIHLARAIAGELNVGYYQLSAPELVGGVSGESETRV